MNEDIMSLASPKNEYKWTVDQSTEAHEYILPRLIELLPQSRRGLTVLDIGCGNGFIASRLAHLGFDVTGIDSSEEGIAIATKAYPDMRFHVTSAYDALSWLTNGVDIVIAAEVIEHLFSPKQFVGNAHKVLKPEGMFLITTPYHGYLKNLALSLANKWDFHHTVNWEGGHIKFFSEKTLSALLTSSGFADISFHNVGRIPWLWKSMVCRSFKR